MWWHDIKEIKVWIRSINDKLLKIDHNVEYLTGHTQERIASGAYGCTVESIVKDTIINAFSDTFCSEDEFNSINRIHDKLNTLVDDANREETIKLAEKTLDKFDDYMKNVDKLNGMINEFKGCVSMARGALLDRKKMDAESDECIRAFIRSADSLRKEYHDKIDAIYKVICEANEKKSRKKRKYVRKKVAPSSPTQSPE